MKKKILAIMLTVASVLSMTACSGKGSDETTKKAGNDTKTTTVAASDKDSKDGKDSKETEKETKATDDQSGKKDSEDPKNAPIWEYTDKGDFEALLPKVETSKVTAKDGEELTVATTSICAPKDEAIKKVKESTLVKSLGALVDFYTESGTANESLDNQWSYEYADGVLCAKQKDNNAAELITLNPFRLEYDYDTKTFTNERCVKLEFYVPDISDAGTQAEIQDLAKAVFGDEIADILLFAKEPDADKYAKNPNSLSVTVAKDGLKYHFYRVYSDAGSLGTKMMFWMELTREKKGGHPYDGGYEAKVSSFKYLPNEVFAGNIGKEDFIDVRSFGDQFYANQDFGDNVLLTMEDNEYSIASYVCEDGREYYTAEFKKYEPSDLHIQYTVGLKDGEVDKNTGFTIKAVSTRLHGKLKDDRDALLDQVKHMFKALTGEDLAFQMSDCREGSEGSLGYSGRTKITFSGKDYETAKVEFSIKESNVSGNIGILDLSSK
ncbi:MAG: hypothetical protein IKG93_06455 [Clostridiales bacterium]|nr:hypothetical protein [Clostridiales bacterium]